MYLPALFDSYNIHWMVDRYNGLAAVAAELNGEGETPEEMVELEAINYYLMAVAVLIESKGGAVDQTGLNWPSAVRTIAFVSPEDHETWMNQQMEKFRLFDFNEDEAIAEMEAYLSGN